MATKPFQPPKLMGARPRTSAALAAALNINQFAPPSVPVNPMATKHKKKSATAMKSSLGPGLSGQF